MPLKSNLSLMGLLTLQKTGIINYHTTPNPNQIRPRTSNLKVIKRDNFRKGTSDFGQQKKTFVGSSLISIFSSFSVDEWKGCVMSFPVAPFHSFFLRWISPPNWQGWRLNCGFSFRSRAFKRGTALLHSLLSSISFTPYQTLSLAFWCFRSFLWQNLFTLKMIDSSL